MNTNDLTWDVNRSLNISFIHFLFSANIDQQEILTLSQECFQILKGDILGDWQWERNNIKGFVYYDEPLFGPLIKVYY